MGCSVEVMDQDIDGEEYKEGDLFVDADGDAYMVVGRGEDLVLIGLTEAEQWDSFDTAERAIKYLTAEYGLRRLRDDEQIVLKNAKP